MSYRVTSISQFLVKIVPFLISTIRLAAQSDVADLISQASAGDINAQVRLAEKYAQGEGVEKNPTMAIDWLTRAAEAGDAKAQYNLGIAHLHAVLGKKNVERAVVWLKRAAEQGYVAAAADLGRIYSTEPVIMNEEEAIKWYRVASNLNDIQSMLQLANHYADRQEYREEFLLIAKAASRGSVIAKTKLGMMYEQGVGTQVDPKKAADCFLSSALNGDAFAQALIAKAYLYGEGVKEDRIQASAWMEIASMASFLPERMLSMKFMFTIPKAQEPQRDEHIKLLKRVIKVSPEVVEFYRSNAN